MGMESKAASPASKAATSSHLGGSAAKSSKAGGTSKATSKSSGGKTSGGKSSEGKTTGGKSSGKSASGEKSKAKSGTKSGGKSGGKSSGQKSLTGKFFEGMIIDQVYWGTLLTTDSQEGNRVVASRQGKVLQEVKLQGSSSESLEV